MGVVFVYQDDSEIWLQDVMDNHYEEALSRATRLLSMAKPDANGCLVTVTATPRRVRFQGRQLPAYRFVYCVLNRAVIPASIVIRHRCHNRLCMNPDHLQEGSKADNKRDDWDFNANGVDYALL